MYSISLAKVNACLAVLFMTLGKAPAQVMAYKGTMTFTLVKGAAPKGRSAPVLRMEVQATGSYNPLTLLNFRLKLVSKNRPATVVGAKVYYSGLKDSFSIANLYGTVQNKNGQLSINGAQELQSGTNYFWMALEQKPQWSAANAAVVQFVSCTTGLQEYQTAWADEFDMDGPPDTANWRYERGFIRNEEDQWYQEQNVFCKNGLLTIEARREDSLPNPRYEAGSRDWRKSRKYIRYTAASINTRGKQQWTYGRWQMKARLDTQGGCWPAWWALGTEGGSWPANGEIDMMEFYREKILANYAIATQRPNTPKWYSTATPVADFGKQNWADSFHQWRMDWDSMGITIYLDEKLLNYQPQDNLYNRTSDSSYFPFRHPQYMLLNFAIGGQNGGDPDYTVFPRRYDVDYVRVLQKQAGRYTNKVLHRQ